MKKPTVFDILKQVNEKTTKFKYDKKIVTGFHLMYWLSHDQYLMPWVQNINKIVFTSGIKDDIIYSYFFHTIPKKNRYIKWIKRDPENTDLIKKLEKISEERNVSTREAELILSTIENINNNHVRRRTSDIPF